ncbi:HNH endonuclease signature motif containing protein [Vibrio coralliilyticus]|uniref:HNH endonuclease signature motif containing protein n=1 Tax=Vibrio coralliilyticus TaxID=190893 RepID=UPI0017990F99|nr:HNH endonuclease signature motif containing protein [Vibrio coralliilyticus]NUW66919.1 HNH endonuclease [Vibrio coralliilyticus]NUW70889.1 HNH endonuclease [Vibrio coralliilyticus]
MKKPCHVYTEEQHDFLARLSALPRKVLTQSFNAQFGTDLSVTAVSSYCKKYRLPAAESGQFQKGHQPWCKGTKGVCQPNAGSFTHGHKPSNLKPIGHERVCTKTDCILVKVKEPNPYTSASTRYRYKHQVLWEAANGPIPKGHVIRFLDGNKRNFELDNLVCISKATNCAMNHPNLKVNEMPEAFRRTGLLIAELVLKTAEVKKQKKQTSSPNQPTSPPEA